jgi:signal transduction histidine kinase
LSEEYEQLERRWERERQARLDAERIAEDGLRRLWETNNELDARVAARTIELERALTEVESANEAKANFLANLGHEVRTPLHAIAGNLELVAGDLHGDDKRRVTTAIGAVHELEGLFTDLLALSQLESGSLKLDVRPAKLAEVIERVAEVWRPSLAKSGQLLVEEVDRDEEVVLDVQRVEQVLDHLLENAARHGHPGSVTLSATFADDKVVLAVRDPGPGIPEQHLERAFLPFTQLDEGSTRKVGGAGIGLALVKGLVELSGGRVETGQDDGFTVTVHVPTHAADDASSNGSTPEPAGAPALQPTGEPPPEPVSPSPQPQPTGAGEVRT